MAMGGIYFSNQLCIADRVKLNGEKVEDVVYLMHVNGENFLDLQNIVLESLITNVDSTNYNSNYAVANPKSLESCFGVGVVPNIISATEAFELLEIYKSQNMEETPKTSRL